MVTPEREAIGEPCRSFLGLGDSAHSRSERALSRRCRSLSRVSVRQERLDESPDERQRLVSDLPPAAVDYQSVAPVRHLDDLGDTLVLLLFLVRGVRDREGSRVVLLQLEFRDVRLLKPGVEMEVDSGDPSSGDADDPGRQSRPDSASRNTDGI